MAAAVRPTSDLSRQFSTGSIEKKGGIPARRNLSFDIKLLCSSRFTFGRQSSLDPQRRSNRCLDELTVPENLDYTMQLLFLACQGDVDGVEELLQEGVDVNSIDLDGRTALHIAACEGHLEVVRLLVQRRANIDGRDRWGSTALGDAKHYGHADVYSFLKAKGAKVMRTRKTPMMVSNPQEIPEYEMNPRDFHFRQGEEILKDTYQVAKWNGTKVSVKILDKESYSNPDSIEAFKHELTLLEKVRHPNVVQFVGAVTQNVPMMIVSDYHPNGNLRSYLQKKGRLKPHKALRFALDIARGMNYLHECKPDPIIHCDLRPKNILLDSGFQLKVAGFGSTNIMHLSSGKAKLAHPMAQIDNQSCCLAPEVYRNEIFDRSVDAFSFGLILYEMIEGWPVFHPKPPEEAAKMICLEGMRPTLKYKSKSYPLELRELIEECWDPEPLVRPTFSEIIIRLDKLCASCPQAGQRKGAFKLLWK